MVNDSEFSAFCERNLTFLLEGRSVQEVIKITLDHNSQWIFHRHDQKFNSADFHVSFLK